MPDVSQAVRRVGAAAAHADGLAVAYLLAVVYSGLALAAAFGADLSAGWSEAVIGLANAGLLGAMSLARRANGKETK